MDKGLGPVVPETHTIVEILPAPANDEEMQRLQEHLRTEYVLKKRTVGMVTGENLLDDLKHVGHINPDKVYFLEV